MKFEIGHWGELQINVQTERRGNTAVLCASDDTTEVSYGGLHASVTLKDLHITVIMNPDKGKWEDTKWARARAWEVVTQNLTPEVLKAFYEAAKEQGHQEGAEEARAIIRKSLGL